MTDAPGTPTPVKDRYAGIKNPFRSRLFTIASVVTLIGAGMWLYAHFTATPGEGASDLARGLTADRPRAVETAAPAAFRLGASFMGGYFLGWALRTFIKVTLLVAGAIAVLIAVGQKTGIISLDWAAMQNHVTESVSSLRGEAEHLRTLLTGLLPSAAAAGTGAVVGVRKA